MLEVVSYFIGKNDTKVDFQNKRVADGISAKLMYRWDWRRKNLLYEGLSKYLLAIYPL